MTVNNDIDYDALADKIASDDWEPSGPSFSIIDLAAVRAFELLRREYAEAVTNAVSFARRAGVSWTDIAAALRVDEVEASANHAARALEPSTPLTDDPGPEHRTVMLDFMVRCRLDAERRLAEAIEQTKSAGGDNLIIGNVLSWTEDEGRLR